MDETANERITMRYDITLCNNAQCKRREKCRRYALWLKWLADESVNKPQQVSMLIHDTDDPLGNDCELFLAINE